MYVRRIQIGRFRHLQDLDLGPFSAPPEQSDVIVLAGPNGGGKSSILELLGYALSNAWSLGWSNLRSFPENSFEVTLAITPDELDIIEEWAPTGAPSSGEALTYLRHTNLIYRNFNFPEGEYNKEPSLQNQAYNLVQQALRHHHQRSLGFFLRADRNYPARGFLRESIFNFANTRQRSHVMSMAYNLSDAQYADMHDFLVQQRYHYFNELGAFEHRRSSGAVDPGPRPEDPLTPYDDLLGRLFPGFAFTDQGGDIPSSLMLNHPGGFSLPFNDLSSGEKEVFFVLSSFLRHDVTDAVVMIDEPELHLHPELARRLLQTMLLIRPRNQIWVATHNTEIIDEAGRDRVLYVARDPATNLAQLTPASEEPESAALLRDFFGFSGYLGVARTMVFLEGTESSADRKTLTSVFPEAGATVKFIPAGGVDSHQRLNAAILAILEETLSYTNFYLIRDRDFLSEEMVTKYRSHASGRVYVLERYHIENYLLDAEIISKVLEQIFNVTVSPTGVESRLLDIADRIAGEVAAAMLGFHMNLILRPQDFSLGGLMKGRLLVNRDGSVDPKTELELKQAFAQRTEEVKAELDEALDPVAVEDLHKRCVERAQQAVVDGSWRSRFPGKRILQLLAGDVGVGDKVVFINSLVKELGAQPQRVPTELTKMMEIILADGAFSGPIN